MPPWRKPVAWAMRGAIHVAGRLFVKGRGLEHAIDAGRALEADHVACTVGYFNADDEPKRAVADAYLAAIDAVERAKLEAYLSIKVPALDFDDALVTEVAHRAKAARIGLHFDSHGEDLADPTFHAVRAASAIVSPVGCTLPGRWRRSVRDADLAADLGLRVRVVKGQWADPSDPARDAREGFLEVVDALAGRAKHVAVATHDPPLAREALRRLRRAGTPCEHELLLGLPMRAALRAPKDLAVSARVYVPFGVAWAPYALEQARKHPHLVGWVIRDALFGRFASA